MLLRRTDELDWRYQQYLVDQIEGAAPVVRVDNLEVRAGDWLTERDVERLGYVADLRIKPMDRFV